MELTTEHEELKRSALRFVEEEINPHVDEWEENEIFPAHDLFKTESYRDHKVFFFSFGGFFFQDYLLATNRDLYDWG